MKLMAQEIEVKAIGKVVFLYGLLTLLQSCSSVNIHQSWIEANHLSQYGDFLILGVSDNGADTVVLETSFVDELQSNKIIAEASSSHIKNYVAINRSVIEKAVSAKTIDSIIVVHIKADGNSYDEQLPVSYMPSYSRGYYSGLYSYYSAVDTYVHGEHYYSNQDHYILEVNLYDKGSEELIWSMRSNSFLIEDKDDVLPELAKLTVQDLKNKGLLRP